jgi:hypothetical protein
MTYTNVSLADLVGAAGWIARCRELQARAEKAETALSQVGEMFGVPPDAEPEELVNLIGARSGPKCTCGPVTADWNGFGWAADPACPVCGPQVQAWADGWYSTYRREVEREYSKTVLARAVEPIIATMKLGSTP